MALPLADFYEEDEPVKELLATFDRGEKVTTGFLHDPGWGQTTYIATDQPERLLTLSSVGNITVHSWKAE